MQPFTIQEHSSINRILTPFPFPKKIWQWKERTRQPEGLKD